MGSYRSEDEALIGLARQLTDAYDEARRREDQDFACESIAAFLHEYRVAAPSEALLAILGLPLTAETYPLVDEAQSLLAGRGPAAVELLLEAVLGRVYDPTGPAPEHAAEALDTMDRRDVAQGLTEVICGRGDDDVKGAAVDGLVALGAFAEPALAGALDDARGSDWARSALGQIRYAQAHPEGLEEYADGEDDVPDDAGELFEEDDSEDGARDDDVDEHADDDQSDGAPDEGAGSESVLEDPAATDGPDQQRVDDAYDEFLRKYQQGSGTDSAPS